MGIDIYLLTSIIGLFVFLISFGLYLKKSTLLKEVEEKLTDTQLEYAILQTKYEEQTKSASEKLQALQDAKEELSNEFRVLSNKIFDDKAKQFSSLNKSELELFLQPFREQIKHFSQEAKEQFRVQTKDNLLLKEELLRLKQLNAQLSQDAHNLTNALKGENKTQGNWGEMVLENILEQSGLRKDVEYELQASLKSDSGKTYRPDVIIHMPQERDIIIDSKVSLVAYERFVNAEDTQEKEQALKAHIVSIGNHVKELSAKAYEKLEGINTLDFVLLFMPIEGAFLLALEKDGEFFKQAYEKNILVVSPSTLLVTLRTIEHIWRTQRQEEHAQKIANEAQAMYEKLVLFVEEMQKMGTHLQRAQDAYDTSMNRLKSGKGNIIKRAENIVKLGIKPKKTLAITSEEEA